MKIKIFSEESIKKYKTDKLYSIISIVSPEYNSLYLDCGKDFVCQLNLKFHDIDNATIENFDTWCKERKLVPFTTLDAQSILLFVSQVANYTDELLIHCEAGRSRSIGVGAALAKIYNNDDSYYFKHYTPNMLVYRTILNTWQIFEERKNYGN